jgi:hypothetical protein
MDNKSTGTFTRTVDLKYILQGAAKYSTESTASPVLHILETDYFDTDLIEKTRHVKRLPRPYSSQEFFADELPFNRARTKPCRVSLASPNLSRFYENKTLYHVQDTVEFYEAITYQHLTYYNFPEQEFTKLRHVRQINKRLRRPIFPEEVIDDIYWDPADILEVDNRYIITWFPQFKRDLFKYQEGNGILLLPADTDNNLSNGYWNSLKLLSHPYYFDEYDIPVRLLEATYLSLRYNFEANPFEFYKYTDHSPVIRADDYHTPRHQVILHKRSIVNFVASSFVTNRLPTDIHLPKEDIYFPLNIPVRRLPVATRLIFCEHLSRTLRVQFHGVPPGLNHHYTTASNLNRYRIKF